ncbi:Uma2 family endonuclease [Oscillatoria sp. CS-180]|uniref:Uma2 family endonuclease n=1 Tax=Oscillatoria sp. CS-180 TaxID=3021720 RepID=UPI0023307FA4|nr:Uma2 family endonuclease [Oscillatoria sp. CS-180]MDB9525266.1 Uma2 family endonuclease [Oscillatoria sp. CS-180]
MTVPATDLTETPTQQTVSDAVTCPPCDLASDEPPLETYQHLQQLLLLIKCLDWLWKDRTDYFAAGNLTIYYSARKLKSEDFRGPDFFVVLNTEKRPRKSWTVWEEEGRYPNVIVELLSSSTAKTDRGLKKQIYQDIFRTPDYFWFDPHSFEFEGFHLVEGRYQSLPTTEEGWRWSEQLGLYLGVHQEQLRFFTPDGNLVPTPEEDAEAERQRTEAERQNVETERQRAEAERQRAEAERQRAEAEQQRAEAERQQTEIERQRSEKLAAKLRELGFDPDTL